MTIASMTGFARVEDADEALRWAWEARAVNGKSLDVRMRLPPGWEALEPDVRQAARAVLRRGNVTISLDVRRTSEAGSSRINEAFLDTLIARCEAHGETPRLDRLLTVRGVVETVETERSGAADHEDSLDAIRESLAAAIDALAGARAEEGARTVAMLRDHLGEIEALVEDAERCADATPDAIRARIAAQLGDLLPRDGALPGERLAQEAALLAVKADVREELDRLRAHIEAARALLREDEAVGRRLDFLCQEFNREANTLASKSAALELTRIGLNLKAVIDRLREQVQNLE
jgi:uncharacterized protein (TIGR00255 family)